MTKEKPKDKLKIPTRTARPKGDMFQNLRRPEQVESLSIQELLTEPLDSTQLTSTQADSTQLDSTQLSPIAPARDYNKRANSIERDALPAGLFPGTSKKLYDALYLRTRGAVVPTRSIQVTRTDLMRWAGIGGLNTFLAHMKHFQRIGLIVRQFEVGNKEGAIYEVRVPEEIDQTQLNSTQLTLTQRNSTRADSTLNRVHDSTPKLSRVEASQTIDYQRTSGVPQTSFKTKDGSDDELPQLFAIFEQLERELTGKASKPLAWRELFELLTAELKIAAARTGQISSVPAFLTEHLRRRLWKKDKAQLERESKEVASEAAPQVDASKCQDCGGSGWWYPEGPEKGVAKCRHAKVLES